MFCGVMRFRLGAAYDGGGFCVGYWQAWGGLFT